MIFYPFLAIINIFFYDLKLGILCIFFLCGYLNFNLFLPEMAVELNDREFIIMLIIQHLF